MMVGSRSELVERGEPLKPYMVFMEEFTVLPCGFYFKTFLTLKAEFGTFWAVLNT